MGTNLQADVGATGAFTATTVEADRLTGLGGLCPARAFGHLSAGQRSPAGSMETDARCRTDRHPPCDGRIGGPAASPAETLFGSDHCDVAVSTSPLHLPRWLRHDGQRGLGVSGRSLHQIFHRTLAHKQVQA